MKHTSYLAALFLALAGPTSVLAQRGYRGGRPAQPVAPSPSSTAIIPTVTTSSTSLVEPTVVRQVLKPSISPILNQLVNEPSGVVQSPVVNQVLNKPTAVVPTAFEWYNPKYNPNPNPSPTLNSNPNPMVNPNPKPNPNPNTAVSTNVPDVATNPGATTPVTTSGTTGKTTTPSSGSSGNGGNGNPWCFEFNMKGISDFFWSIPGGNVWPAGSGDSSNANQCVPGATTGGSMFFGVVQNPAKCNTELECNFPNGQGQNTMPNCDISLVDGYSLNVACTIPGGSAPIGYNGNLNAYSNSVGHACQSPKSGECCQNLQGPSVSSPDQVDPFFSPAADTCFIYQAKGTQSFFTGSSITITCTVSPGYVGGTSSKEKRENKEGVQHRHGHKERAHARGLRDFMRGFKP
ncbi:hypothetical protein OEA41_005347 [Lepraria neglecta]|uniref:Uncharacterized protein n=1 Tax=Lepraria neglecta TaxID=209136 RepID=A0AAD9YZ93_9LECA|nr:hypothetical protein OEA41_005347 [Lepraria neglecta]